LPSLLQLVASVVARPRRDTASHAAVFYYGAASPSGSMAVPSLVPERIRPRDMRNRNVAMARSAVAIAGGMWLAVSRRTPARVGRALATLAFYLTLLVISLTPPWETAWDRLSPLFAGGCFSPASWRRAEMQICGPTLT
jgi:hypothetical protein